MSLNDTYFNMSQFAKREGISPQTLDKLVKDAEGSEFALGEPDGTFNGRVWHVEKWEKLQGYRIRGFVDRAIELGLVVSMDVHMSDIREAIDTAHAAGYKKAYDEIKSQRLVTEPLDETKDVDFSGLTSGGFQSIV